MSEVLRSVICGVDGSEAALSAARQASRLADRDGDVTLLAVEDAPLAVHAGWGAAAVMEQLSAEAARALEVAATTCAPAHPVGTRVREGDPAATLLDEAEASGATLVAVGARGHSRALGILSGSVATTVVHEAPCSILVGRPTPARWPRQIVVGVDGTPEARTALAVARELSARLAVELVTIEERAGDPADTLVAAAAPDDLLVVGSRGLKGLRALGSVSERVAHGARCPVLVVRARKETTDEDL